MLFAEMEDEFTRRLLLEKAHDRRIPESTALTWLKRLTKQGGAGKCGRQGGRITRTDPAFYMYTYVCVRKKGGVPTVPRVPVNSLQSAKGSEEITPYGREVIFAMSKGTSRHPSQDYKNFGTRFRGSCTKFHRILQQCAPLFFGLCFLSTFHSSTIHFSILRVSALKFTPILKSFRLSEAKGSA